MTAHTCNCGGQLDQFEELAEVIERYRGVPGALIPVLHQAQLIFGYLPEEVQSRIAEGLGIPFAEVYGVVTFYNFFTIKPKGKYKIAVCLGTACYVKGAAEILTKLEEELGIKDGDVTPDRLFSLDVCRCIGACGMAPVLMVNENVHGNLVPDSVKELLKHYREVDAGEVDRAAS